jgi:3'(2'), 5'-bisphosphate nucleotidase
VSTVAGTSYARAAILERALVIAEEASAIVLGVYAEAFDVEYKGKDDPVTRADKLANAHIANALAASFPGIPIVAEESDPSTFAGFEAEKSAFFVDPLDGTREFVARNGQFAVMIGLAEEGRATLGVIVCPTPHRTFAAADGHAFKVVGGVRKPLRVSPVTALADARIVVSRSHKAKGTDEMLARFAARQVDQVGSAGVKGTLVCCGEADVYVHLGMAGKRWDSCAPEAIIHAAGGKVTDATGAPFDYRSAHITNDRGILATNGTLHPLALSQIPAR